MDGLDINRFVYDNLDDLSRKQLKSNIVAHSSEFDDDWSFFLNKQLGSSTSSSSSDDGDCSTSKSDDGGDGGDCSSTDGSDSSTSSDGDGDDVEGLEDTHMKMFLEKLAPDGTSYVLKRDGKPDLKFEGMDEDSDGSCGSDENVVDQKEISSDCESEPGRRRGNDLDVRSGGGRGKGILRADGMGNSRNGKESGNVERRGKGVKNVGKKRNGKDILVEEVDVMPVKKGGKTFKNVEKGKDSLVENVDVMQVKRKEKDVKNVEKKLTFMENKKYRSVEEADLTQGNRKAKNVEKQKSFMEIKRNDLVEDVDLRPDGRRLSRDVKENEKLERRANNVKNVKKEKKFKENERDSSTEKLGIRFEKQHKVSYKSKRCLSGDISEVEFDPEWKMFLNQCDVEGDNLISFANGKRLIYGEDDNKSLSDSDVYVLDHAPDCIESNYAPTLNYNAHMEEDDLQCLGSCGAAENPEFRKAVMDVLRKPFNIKEYIRLRKDVKVRKPTERHVDMRSGNTSFQQTTMGKSYLDHYADLRKQFNAFKNDIPKRLNILRGFFFYLKRMADDGKFKPWLDDSCLAIIPRTS